MRRRDFPQSKCFWQIVEPSRVSCMKIKKFLARKSLTGRVEHEGSVINDLGEGAHGTHEGAR